MNYLHWDEKTITDFSEENVADMYARGYVFTRIGKGVMHQTRSVRINLARFELSSENRRILKKVGANMGGTGTVSTNVEGVPLYLTKVPLKEYDWSIGKMAKDFYENKFGAGIMSAAKVKEMLTDPAKSNFNALLTYKPDRDAESKPLGYAICYSNATLLHYSYPFYDLAAAPKDMGLGMMIQAIQHAKETGKRFVYLGSLQRPGDTYKLQFSGLEWFDGGPPVGGGESGAWRKDTEAIKDLLKR